MNLTSEQKLIRATARKITQQELAPQAAEVDRDYRFPHKGLRILAEAGLMGMLVPPDYGGGGADSLSFVLALEAIAGACASTALVLFAHNVASLALSAVGSEALKSRYLPSLAGTERLAAIAHTEPNAGVSLAAIETAARREGEHYVLDGAKSFITSAGQADLYLVFAKTANPPGLSVLVVEDGTPGFSFGRQNEMMGFHGSSEGELVFEDCRVPGENLLGEEGGGLKVVGPTSARHCWVRRLWPWASPRAPLRPPSDTRENESSLVSP
jgi:butyryl-CoA dehydrogenase